MKIETIVQSHKNQTVKYSGGIKVSYNAQGVAEVPEDIGDLLITKYRGQIFTEGKVVQPMVRTSPAAAAKEAENGVVQELREKLQKANSLVADYKAQAGMAQENERVWRMKCEELMNTLAAIKEGKAASASETKPPVFPGDRAEKGTSPQIDDTATLRDKLNAKNIKELQKIAAELKLPVKDYEKLNKNKLVDYLIQQTTNANS
jgi:hypothetical protein